MPKNPIEYQKLNDVLKLFFDKRFEHPYNSVGESFGNIKDGLDESKDYKDLTSIIQKLLKDGYIDNPQQALNYKITYDGIILHIKGGYRIEHPSWYDRNKDWLLVIIGALVGGIISIGLSYLEKSQPMHQIEIEQIDFPEIVDVKILKDSIK